MYLRGIALTALASSALLAQGSPSACGVERWPVKIASDRDAPRIGRTPVRSTVSQLAELPRPGGQLPRDQRTAPYELTTFRVIAAIREVLSPENDGDLHVVLQDLEDASKTMVAEVPDSGCALESSRVGDFAAAYRALLAAPPHAIVIVDGIGFFDFAHGQRGVAPNAFELHPIVALRVVGQLSEVGHEAKTTPTIRADTSKAASTRVWVNTASMVYHCQGTRWYGATKSGSYMTQREAIAAGARPAYGRGCSR